MSTMKKIDELLNEWKDRPESKKFAEELESVLGKNKDIDILVNNFYDDLQTYFRISKDLTHLFEIYKAHIACKNISPSEFMHKLMDKWDDHEEGLIEILRDRLRVGY